MRCPSCNSLDTQVKDSRPTEDSAVIRRRRVCVACIFRFLEDQFAQKSRLSKAADQRFMALALALGRRGQGRTWPNPAVGAVVVRDGVIVGRGWTQAGGRPHAEREALGRAGEAARGATLYATLEPCSHFGKSPPCADAVIAA